MTMVSAMEQAELLDIAAVERGTKRKNRTPRPTAIDLFAAAGAHGRPKEGWLSRSCSSGD